MIVDAVEMFASSNPYKRRHERKSNKFFTKVVPFLGFIRDFVIIMAVIILADSMLWIAITLLFVSMTFGEINQFFGKPSRYFLSPKNWGDITQLILIAAIMYEAAALASLCVFCCSPPALCRSWSAAESLD